MTDPEWAGRGKSISDLIRELQSFEDQAVEVRISVDGGRSSFPISLVGKVNHDGNFFAILKNSQDRPAPIRHGEHLPETLVVVERDGIHRIEIREVVQEGDSYFLIFARSDGTEVRVPIDGAKLKATVDGQVPADSVYIGGAVVAPRQDV